MNYRKEELLTLIKGVKLPVASPNNIVIPNVESEDEQGNKRVKDIFSTLNDARIIMVDGEVNDLMASVVCGQLLQLSSASETDPIYMYINSPGGSITSGLAIFDTMMSVKCPVITIGMGMCASMGAFLLSAGNLTGGAKVLPNCEVMIHQPLGGFRGQATDIDIHAKRILKMKEDLTAYLAYFCSQNKHSLVGRMNTTEEKIERLRIDCERDNFMTAEEAYNYGLVSEILLLPRHKATLEKMKAEGFIK